MTNSYPSGSPGVPDSSMPTGAPGFMPRRSSYASVVSGTASGASQPFLQPARSGAFSHLLNQHPELTYDSSFPSYSGYSRYENRGYDMDYSTNGGSHGRSGSWGRGGQLPSFSSAFGLLMSGHGYGGFGGGHTDQFFVPSYLKGSKYVQKLEEAHKAKLSAHKEGNSAHSSQPGSLSTSASSINLHAKMAPSHRGMTYDLIEKAPPLEDEILAPLPSKWNNQDKHGALEVLSDGQEVKFTGPKPERDRDHEAYAIRADHPMPPQCGIYYFEVTIISRKREESSIGIGFSSKTVPLSRLPGWEPESWAYHGDDGHSFCCQNSGKHYGPPFTAGDVIGCGVNFRTGSAFFTKNGDHLGTAFREIKGKLYPSVGMKKAGEHVRVNFGQSPFIFDIDGMMSASNLDFIDFHFFNPQYPSPGPATFPGDLTLDGASATPMAPAPAGPRTADDTPEQNNLPLLNTSSTALNQAQLRLQQNGGPLSRTIFPEIIQEVQHVEDLRVRSEDTRARAEIARAAVDVRFGSDEVSAEDIGRERRRDILELDPIPNTEELARLLSDDASAASAASAAPAQSRGWMDEACEELYRSIWTRPLYDLSTPDNIRDIRAVLRSRLLGDRRYPLSEDPSPSEITALIEGLRDNTMLEIVRAVTLQTAEPRTPTVLSIIVAADTAMNGRTGMQEQASNRVTGSPVPQVPANTASAGAQEQANGDGESQRPMSAGLYFAKTLTDFQLQQEKKHIRQEIEGTSIAKLAPPLNETELIQSLVLQFLTHDGYVETAKAFSEEVHGEKKALSLDPNAEVNGFDVREDEDAGHRQRIRAAVLDGDVEKALKYTNTFYPNVLKDNEHVYFRLRCRKFIEMIRQGAELHNSSSTNGTKKSNGHSGDWYDEIINQEMDVDDHPSQSNNWDRMDTEEPFGNQMEYQRLLSETLAYGQDLQAEFKNDPRREVSKALEDAFALIAYEDPINAKEVSHLLDPSGRVAVAEELNSAILLSLGKSSSAALEQLYQQTCVLLEDLREGGGPGAFVNIDDFARPKMGQ